MEDGKQFLHKALKSPPDSRDWILEQIQDVSTTAIPNTFDMRKSLMPIRNQGNRGTCVAFAGSAIKEWHERQDVGFNDYMSPEFIYWHRTNKPNDGMYIRDLLKILMDKGCCPEYIVPYNIFKDLPKLPKDAVGIADDYKIKGYARVETVQGLKSALVSYGPCVMTLNVYSEIRPKFWRPQSDDDKKSGSHAVAVVGYNDDGFIIRNSWGLLWNLNGYVTFPYKDFKYAKELWSTVDIKGSKKPKPGCSFFSLCKGGVSPPPTTTSRKP